jgi:ATP-dependent Clp protease adapter protein ClpS
VFESAFIPFVATAASVAIATGLRRHSARKRQIILTVILQTAISDVTRRGHGTITPEHLLWTLLDVPEVAAACSARGWFLVELRDAIDARLKGLEASKTRGVLRVVLSAELADLVQRQARAAARHKGSPLEAGRATLSSLVRELLAREARREDSILAHGPDQPYETFALGGVAEPVTPGGGLSPSDGPYRHMAVPSQVSVVFWNDPRTTMDGVTEILAQVFNMSDVRATYLTWVTHRLGSAVVWSSERFEAERLAARATDFARAKGMSLRISVEQGAGDAR